MFRKSIKIVFAVLLVLGFSSVAPAFQPQDAISARPAESVYTVLRVDDLNGLMQYVFSPANVEMVASVLKPEQAGLVGLAASLASQIPAKSAAVASGMTAEGPFMQVAVSIPASDRPKLDKVADGSADGADIITLLLGDGAEMFADGFEPEVQDGDNGPFYSLMGQAALAARDDLLLIAFPPNELDAAIDALENDENRLSFKRRFDSPDYWLTHMDLSMTAMFAAMAGGAAQGDPDALAEFFKAPLEYELAFESKPESFLLSCAANIMEALADAGQYKDMNPNKGGSLFLAGGGKVLFALSSPLALNAAVFKADPGTAAAWEKFIQVLASMDITEGDAEDLLNGSFSAVLGSEATVMGASIPGGYLALTGREGTAARIFGKLIDNENMTQAVPLVPLEADGWDSAFAADTAAFPAPVVFGVKRDTLFVGVLDSNELTRTPEIPDEIAPMLDESLLGIGVIDTAGIWDRLRREVSDPNSLLSLAMGGVIDAFRDDLDDVLSADLSVPLVKIWSPELETAFMEFTVVDVPQDKRLLPRLLNMVRMFVPQESEDEDEDE